MDQDNSKGQDKRNWRERLGIGAQGGRDLPKISDDFKKEVPAASPRPVASARPAPRVAAPAVKPAPMAPRANPKPIASAPVAPDKLAERLRSQREASTKLAEQRVLVAKQRAEAQPVPPPPPPAARPAAPTGAKPKFTFAEENNGAPVAVQPVAPPPPTPARVAPPVQQPPAQPQMAPARPPLGGGNQAPPAFQPRPPQPQYAPPPNYQQQPAAPIGYQPQYNQQPVPPYRPIDPNTGFAPPSGYVPQQRGFTPPPQGQFMPPQNGPRLNLPQRNTAGFNPNFQQPPDYSAQNQTGFGAPPPRQVRPQMRAPVPPPPEDEELYDDQYEDAPTALSARRPSTNDYQQAYREAEYGYEEELPRSKAPWILAGLLLLALAVAGLGVWLYLSSVKPLMTGQTTTDQVPAVAAPETPAKVQAEPAAGTGDAAQPAVATPTKKQIYDRIVGDQEVLGGELAPAQEAPAAIPEPVNNADPATAPPATGSGGEEAAPLPIPPPPGDAGGQQGQLAPDTGKQSVENITPAASESQAAVVASGTVEPPPPAVPAAAAPVPGEISTASNEPPAQETIEDPAPTAPVKKIVTQAKKKPDVKKEVATRSLGAKPVVLVPPSKKAIATSKKSASQSLAVDDVAANTNDGGLYSNDFASPAVVAPATPAVTPKKKKTLADLFRGNDAAENAEALPADVATIEPAPEPIQPLKKAPVAPKPVEQQQQASLGGFAVQLASFRSRNEASTEFSRLKAKHAETLGRFSPIISEAVVGGSTRYRLSVGGMTTQAQASAVCSSLFAGGERDCLVKKQ